MCEKIAEFFCAIRHNIVSLNPLNYKFIDGGDKSGIMQIGGERQVDELLKNLEFLFESPQTLGRMTPDEWYKLLCERGYEVKPLGDGRLKDIDFKYGGGFRVNWNGNGGASIFQYHPAAHSHHDGAYYKISNGVTGTKWYNLDGSPQIRT